MYNDRGIESRLVSVTRKDCSKQNEHCSKTNEYNDTNQKNNRNCDCGDCDCGCGDCDREFIDRGYLIDTNRNNFGYNTNGYNNGGQFVPQNGLDMQRINEIIRQNVANEINRQNFVDGGNGNSKDSEHIFMANEKRIDMYEDDNKVLTSDNDNGRNPVNVNVILGSGNTESRPFNYSESPVFEPAVIPPVINPHVINPMVNEPVVFIQAGDGRVIPVPESQAHQIVSQGGGQVVQPSVRPQLKPTVEQIRIPQEQKEEECYWECFYKEFP